MSRDTCRYPSCDDEPRGSGGFSSLFCSDECEVRYDHIKADAQDAERSEAADFGGGESTGVQDL
jgi:hypothetical protein